MSDTTGPRPTDEERETWRREAQEAVVWQRTGYLGQQRILRLDDEIIALRADLATVTQQRDALEMDERRARRLLSEATLSRRAVIEALDLEKEAHALQAERYVQMAGQSDAYRHERDALTAENAELQRQLTEADSGADAVAAQIAVKELAGMWQATRDERDALTAQVAELQATLDATRLRESQEKALKQQANSWLAELREELGTAEAQVVALTEAARDLADAADHHCPYVDRRVRISAAVDRMRAALPADAPPTDEGTPVCLRAINPATGETVFLPLPADAPQFPAQVDLPPDAIKVLHDNLPALYETCEPPAATPVEGPADAPRDEEVAALRTGGQ